jgi:peptidylprolyl isomerase
VRRRLLALTVVSFLLLGSAACGGDSGGSSSSANEKSKPIPGVEVTGDFGAPPKVKIDTPLKPGEPQTQVVIAGKGNPVQPAKSPLLNVYLANGTSGKKAFSSWDQGNPTQVPMDAKKFFPSVVKSMVGKPQGSRVAMAGSVKSFYGAAGASQLGLKPTDSMVLVLDVMSVDPTDVLKAPKGTTETPPAGLPTVVEKNGDVTNLDFSNAKKPADKLQVIPLVEGTGPAARAKSLVTFNYFGEQFGAKKPFDESFSKQPVTFPLGVGGLIKGWDKGLVGVKQGSRVMIVAPPEYAYGARGNPQGGIDKNATLVFVVDVLGVDS